MPIENGNTHNTTILRGTKRPDAKEILLKAFPKFIIVLREMVRWELEPEPQYERDKLLLRFDSRVPRQIFELNSSAKYEIHSHLFVWIPWRNDNVSSRTNAQQQLLTQRNLSFSLTNIDVGFFIEVWNLGLDVPLLNVEEFIFRYIPEFRYGRQLKWCVHV